MIKCSKATIKYSNTNKINHLHEFINEYKKVLEAFIDLLWNEDKFSRLLPKNITDQIDSWLSQRAIQCAGKQASGIVRGTQQKQKRRQFIYDKLVSEGRFKRARRLKRIIDQAHISKPSIDSLEVELDSRFVFFDWENGTSFDGWITLTSLGNKLKIKIPIRRTKHFNKLFNEGTLKAGVRLSKKMITFNFDLPEVEKKTSGEVLGIDIGSKTVISCSNGFQSRKDTHGHNLDTIQNRLSRRKRGSKRFQRSQNHRTNHINWSVNQLDVKNIKKIRIEKIKHLRRGRKSSRKLSHWTYTTIFDKLEDLCNSTGVQLEQVNPAFTSQRCSQCGWVRKSNRRGKLFKCNSCSYECDADLNASKNIVLDLSYVGETKRLSKANRVGFYWF